MKNKNWKKSIGHGKFVLSLLIGLLCITACNGLQKNTIEIEEQGSFTAGGTVMTDSAGNTFHGDHAYVFYQKPVDARKYPLVFVHGTGQFSKTWETTPDGREGFQNIFLRRRFSTYLIDQPRRGSAGRSTSPADIRPVMDEAIWFNRFRLGIYPDYFPNVQFKQDRKTLEEFYRQMTPNIGAFDFEVVSDGVARAIDKIGASILVTHSQGGPVGWKAFLKTDNVKAIVAYEPGGLFPFPQGENPSDAKTPSGVAESTEIPLSDFMKYTQIPIVIYYGDFLPEHSDNPEQNYWRLRLELARKWAECVNEKGGDVTVVHLPEIGVHGNTHFPFSDLNNIQIADLLSEYLHDKKLD